MKKFEDYDNLFPECEEEGIIRKVPTEALKILGYYLPHHPVIKLNNQTTSIRPVFDAYDRLFKGPNLMEQIPAIIARFR